MAYLQFLQRLKEKQTVFKCWTTIQLYAQTNFPGWLKMTANIKAVISPVIPKVLVRSGVELARQAENNTAERFRHYNLHVKINELFSPGPLD